MGDKIVVCKFQNYWLKWHTFVGDECREIQGLLDQSVSSYRDWGLFTTDHHSTQEARYAMEHLLGNVVVNTTNRESGLSWSFAMHKVKQFLKESQSGGNGYSLSEINHAEAAFAVWVREEGYEKPYIRHGI